LLLLLPWPAAIGDRRFHQGLLIRGHRTGKVAVGTVGRVAAMLTTALGLAWGGWLPGASVAAAALSAGVLTEMFLVRRMVAPVLRPLREEASRLGDEVPENLTQPAVWRFYQPLVWTSFIALAAQPIITFFMGRAPRSLESLAVLPVIHGLTFVFRALALSYQEVGIALFGDEGEHYRPVRDFGLALSGAVFVALALIAFTPLADLWLRRVAGLDIGLAEFARGPLQVYALLPTLSVLQSLQRSVLVHGHRTGPMGRATAVEILVLASTLAICVLGFGVVGAYAAAIATLTGRVAGLSVLIRPVRRVEAAYTRIAT
jgi:hypothetical protein